VSYMMRCAKIQLVLWDSDNRYKVKQRKMHLFLFSVLSRLSTSERNRL